MYKIQSLNLFRHFKDFFNLLKTAEFSKGIRFAVAVLVPLLVTGYLGVIEIGMAMAIGVLLSSPSDVPGSLRRRVIGVSFSVVIAVFATLVIGFSLTHPVIFILVLVLLTFHFSMISVFGFRASLIAFSGLFAIVLSMAQVASEGGIIQHSLWIGAGGIWYLLFSLALHYFLRRRETDQLLAEAFDLTANYLEIRGRLMAEKEENREKLEKEVYDLQTSINEKHELIREMLITRRRNFGRSGMVRKRLLIFMELVDILELSMANPVNYQRMEELFKEHPDKIGLVKDWSFIMARNLRMLGGIMLGKKGAKDNESLHLKKAEVWQDFEIFAASAKSSEDEEVLLVYKNLLNFKEKQYQKILSIERLLKEWEKNKEFRIKRRDAAKFLTTPDYNLKTLEDHLDLKSPIFRHSLRLSVTLVIGYALGNFFEVQNAYWILLTILVIMRPGYALTRDRFKQRLYGTIIGGVVAVSLVLIIRNTVVYGILAVISLVLAHSMIQRNYKTAAAFITLNVVFIYSLLRPDVLQVIEYRVLDTAVGAGLAFLGAKFLWPTWEYSLIQNFIKESTKANSNFIKEIETFYQNKSKLPASYRLARKHAFLAMGDLSAAFQRMAQEPGTEKGHLEATFKIVSLNQEFLSGAASLGTFIRSHPTTEASEHFKNYMAAIRRNLDASEGVNTPESLQPSEEIRNADRFYEELYKKLLGMNRENGGKENIVVRERLEEVQIIMDRLKWLLEISDSIKKLQLKA